MHCIKQEEVHTDSKNNVDTALNGMRVREQNDERILGLLIGSEIHTVPV